MKPVLTRSRPAWMLGLLLLAWPAAFGAEFAPFDPSLKSGAHCTVAIAKLHPTQVAFGQNEIDERAKKFTRLSATEQEEYLKEKTAPIVIGPGGLPYLLDHHHLARLLLQTGLKTILYAEVSENWSGLADAEFWARMKQKNWVYLYDENGKGPIEPAALPAGIAQMRDDPYRSLAWFVREQKGYKKRDDLFAEFQWANFFRDRIKIEAGPEGFDRALQEALTACHSHEAKDLPGYISAKKASRKKSETP